MRLFAWSTGLAASSGPAELDVSKQEEQRAFQVQGNIGEPRDGPKARKEGATNRAQTDTSWGGYDAA